MSGSAVANGSLDAPLEVNEEEEEETENAPIIGMGSDVNLLAMLQQLAFLQEVTQLSSHQQLCDHLQKHGHIRSAKVVEAFAATDRRNFLPGAANPHDSAYLYSDSPIKFDHHYHVHHSAPSIYGTALEALDLRPGLSFLNIGSGTGWFSSMVSHIVGTRAVHHAIEIRPRLVEIARLSCAAQGYEHIVFHCGSCRRIDASKSIGFDRIYIGASVDKRTRPLILEMLAPGGIAVGPFDREGVHSSPQCLLKVRREGEEREYPSEVLISDVSFSSLLTRLPPEPIAEGAGAGPASDGRQTLNEERDNEETSIILRGPRWGEWPVHMFPTNFIRVVSLLVWMCKQPQSLPGRLPWEIWATFVLPHLPFDCFEEKVPPPPQAIVETQEEREKGRLMRSDESEGGKSGERGGEELSGGEESSDDLSVSEVFEDSEGELSEGELAAAVE